MTVNIPTEIFRTMVAVAEMGSLTKAASKVGLSQPAVSAQMKRIEQIVGGLIFSKTANGSEPTDLGKMILHQARKIIEANDQVLRYSGSQVPHTIRLGLSTLFVRQFVRAQSVGSLAKVHLHSDHSIAIAKGVVDGFIDIACIFENPEIDVEIRPYIVNEFDERLVWVRSPDFTLSPGTPLPVLTWPGDDWMIRTLTANNVAFRVVMSSSDYHAKEVAVEAGIGLTAVPSRMVPPTLVVAEENYLPKLPKFTAYLCARPSARSPQAIEFLDQLTTLFFQKAN